jgi:LPS-assembly protein
MTGAPLRHSVRRGRARAALLAWLGAAALATLPLLAGTPSHAATTPAVQSDLPFTAPAIGKNEKMLVESDQLLYDYDHNSVAAVGNVKIYYAGYTLQADKVLYNKNTKRLVATGNVKLVDPSGAAVSSDYIDVTDDFRDGFIQSLRLDTPDETHFAAERAERNNAETTTFENGVYTACAPCAEHPEKPPLWQVKATKIVVNHKEHVVQFTGAQIEFFGKPIAELPYFSIPDTTVKRKSGFLIPNAGYSARTGFFASIPYYWALNPSYDLTITPSVFSRQGLLATGEWRQRTANGQYSIIASGIDQLDPSAFDLGSPSRRTMRGGIRTTGTEYLNNDWTLGWDGTLSTDRLFTRDYSVLNQDTSVTTSNIHLTGIGDRNYFNAEADYFQLITDPSSTSLVGKPWLYDQNRQAWAAPVIDYNRIGDNQIFGGEVTYTSNVANVVRAIDDPYFGNTQYAATAGDTLRATQEVDWKRQFVGPMGQLITPWASLRGDVFAMNSSSAAVTSAQLTDATLAGRFMPAVGVDWSLPILATTAHATHIIEPIAQLIVRPDETDIGMLPNNDAQSLVFDTSTLFQHDKFSGFDRVEGGTRANLGLHYNGSFANGASVNATVGESIQLAGTNSFAGDATYGVGANSGLDTKYSDYVAGVSVDTGVGPSISAETRFDQSKLDLNRAEIQATTALGPVTASAAYLYLRDDPLSLYENATATSASVVRGAASIALADNWRAFGTLTYDVVSHSVAGDSFGIAFDNECLTLSVAYSQTVLSDDPNQWLTFRLALRTFGEGGINANLGKLNN